MNRYPIVAGSFYPLNKTSLSQQIDFFLTKTKVVNNRKKLKILLVPHAGYDYSGQTAAWGFKQLEKLPINNVILLGSSHQSFFTGAIIANQGGWLTPLGKVIINQSIIQSLINKSNLLKINNSTHQNEHSLEVQLPFLQKVLPNFKIVPILLGALNKQIAVTLAKTIANNLNEHTLLLISSDLAHYPDYITAKKVDKETISAILTGNLDIFNLSLRKNSVKVDTSACAEEAIRIALLVAQILKLKAKILAKANSGDITGDKNRVVGYASIGFYK